MRTYPRTIFIFLIATKVPRFCCFDVEADAGRFKPLFSSETQRKIHKEIIISSIDYLIQCP